jgi:hypothetical protein
MKERVACGTERQEIPRLIASAFRDLNNVMDVNRENVAAGWNRTAISSLGKNLNRYVVRYCASLHGDA